MKTNLLIVLLIVVCNATTAFTQDQAIALTGDPQIDKLTTKLLETIEEFRDTVREAQRIGFKYVNAQTFDEAFPYSDEFYEKVEQGNAIREKLIPLAIELFDLKVAGTGAKDELAHLVTNIMNWLYERGEYSRAYRLAGQLVINNPDNEFAKLYLARSGLLNNDFSPRVESIITKHREFFDEDESVSEREQMIILNIKVMQAMYARELEIQAAEAKADDLPRVEFKTSKGDFVIELFENEAPQTVANFISVVESGHYDGLLFHTVINQIAAETGVVTADGQVRELDYTIYDEYEKPDARMNFSGSVSLNSEKRNTGSARFFVSLAPLPNFNRKQTVFGRILTGMDTVYRINQTYKFDGEEQIPIEDVKPDKVVSAKVLRKRDHEYKPVKVEK